MYTFRTEKMFYVVLAAICFTLLGCRNRGTIAIEDVTKTNIINIISGFKGTGSDIPQCLTLRVYGNVEGTAYFYIYQEIDSSLLKKIEIQGNVDWNQQQDWCLTNCVIYYIPKKVTGGTLSVKYVFD
jgi:hypothetical protein